MRGRASHPTHHGIEFPVCMNVVKDPPSSVAAPRLTLSYQAQTLAFGCILNDVFRVGSLMAGQTSSVQSNVLLSPAP
jgi:hypothetical protein